MKTTKKANNITAYYHTSTEKQRLYSFFDQQKEKYGFINQNGQIVIEPKFDRIEYNSSGFYTVATNHGNGWFYGYVGRDGLFLAPKYHEAESFEKGFVHWHMDSLCHILRNGLVVDNRCVEPQVNGLMILNHSVTKDGHHQVLNICGEHVFTFPEDVVTEPSIKNDDGYTKIDDYGNYYKDWYVEPDGILTKCKFDGTRSLYLASIDHNLCYINNDKAVVLDVSEYDDAFDFSCGLARVLKDGKYGFIDPAGNIVIPVKLDDCEDFFDGSAFFRDCSKEPFSVSKETESEPGHQVYTTIIQRQFIRKLPVILKDSIEKSIEFIGLYNDFTTVSCTDDKYILTADFADLVHEPRIDIFSDASRDSSDDDNEITDNYFTELICSIIMSVFEDYCEAWGRIDTTGKIIVEPQTGPGRPGDIGLFPMHLIVDGKEKACFINHDWQLSIPVIFDRVEPFQKGMAKVFIDGKEGLIKLNGEYLITPEYDHLNISTTYLEFIPEDNKFYGDKDNKRYMFNMSGHIINGVQQSSSHEIIPGLFEYSELQDTNLVYGIKDCSGKILCGAGEFRDFKRLNDSFVAFIDENGTKGHIDKQGNIVRDKYTVIRDCGEGMTFVSELANENSSNKGELNFLIDPDLIKYPLEHGTRVDSNFHDGRAYAINFNVSSDSYGFINTKGQLVIPCIFKNVKSFHNGFAKVSVNGGWGIIDIDGNFVIPPVLDDICGYFHNGYIWVVYIGKMYEMDAAGNLYDHRIAIGQVSSPIPKKIEDRWGYVNRDGKFVIPALYDTADFFNLDFATASQNGWPITIDYEGKVIRA